MAIGHQEVVPNLPYKDQLNVGRYTLILWVGIGFWFLLPGHQSRGPPGCTSQCSYSISQSLGEGLGDKKNWKPILGELLLMDKILNHQGWWLSHYLQGFEDPRWCRISSINSNIRSHGMLYFPFFPSTNKPVGRLFDSGIPKTWRCFCWKSWPVFDGAKLRVWIVCVPLPLFPKDFRYSFCCRHHVQFLSCSSRPHHMLYETHALPTNASPSKWWLLLHPDKPKKVIKDTWRRYSTRCWTTRW